MKPSIFLFALLLTISACTDSSQTPEDKPDSTTSKLDSHWRKPGMWEGEPMESDSTIWENEPDEVDAYYAEARGRTFSGKWSDDEALKILYPGNFVRISPYMNGDSISVVTWICPECTPDSLDGWDDEYPEIFPYQNGVDSRQLLTYPYTTKNGKKRVLFLTSSTAYSPDFILSGRFMCGIVGVAVFEQQPDGWQVNSFNPALTCAGAFGQAPPPDVLILGNGNDPSFALLNKNGGPGGPFIGDLEVYGYEKEGYAIVLVEEMVHREYEKDDQWNYQITPHVAGCKFCPLDLTMTGFVNRRGRAEWDRLPTGLDSIPDSSFAFTWKRRLEYKEGLYRQTESELKAY